MIKISDFSYDLPQSKIAQYPLKNRDESKLLLFKSGKISHKTFNKISEELSKDSLLISNNTKVIPARLIFEESTGAHIEIFLLDPIFPSTEVVKAMEARGKATWKCMIGNLKRWKDGQVLLMKTEELEIRAELRDRVLRHVELTWQPADKMAVDVIHEIGKIPIPPYMNRDATDEDKDSYQTVYAKNDGAVAAPTAGLHFTNSVLNSLDENNIKREFVTLHIGAGTFQPVKEEGDVTKHNMHAEQFVVKKRVLEQLLEFEGNVTVVGTTSMRTLESCFWLGNQAFNNVFNGFVSKLEPYECSNPISYKESFRALIDFLDKNQLEELHACTEIMIVPGYDFKVCDHLVTNFHQPESTLMLLVAAFVGENWKSIYEYALKNDFRFLSYGDSSLLSKGA
ncbi:MAG: S-adenosylmethionine tRNA ribosyltransferase [Flavobacteriales bacterium]|nr:S-adenosylmethionine tRNA ribosyltransferase [Flavobacteriales bacterium]